MSDATITPGQAKKSYMFRMLGASFGYVGAIIAAAIVIDEGDPVSAITIVVAAIPALFILLMMRALWRYIREADEVARHDITQAMMDGLFIVLAVSSSWGLIEMFNASLPRLPVFWMFPLFFAVFGIVSGIRYGRWT